MSSNVLVVRGVYYFTFFSINADMFIASHGVPRLSTVNSADTRGDLR